MGRENESRNKVMKYIDEKKEPLTQGMWSDGTSWSFVVSSEPIDPALCTAVFCITTYEGKLLLTENGKRGWEIPGGHKEEGESIQDAVIREVAEETGAVIDDIEMFGFKVISPESPVPHRDRPGEFYPFPHSYIPYFFAEAKKLSPSKLAEDVRGVKSVSLNEAKEMLAQGHNHDILLDYLKQLSKIEID